MEPLTPQMREALKRANPGLTDRDIDLSEELLAQLQDLDPEDEPKRHAELQRDLRALIRDRMPRYREVAHSFTEVLRKEARLRTRSMARVFNKSNGER